MAKCIFRFSSIGILFVTAILSSNIAQSIEETLFDVQKVPRKQSAICFGKAEKGPCRALLYRYYYNKNNGTCEKFIYGGCRGNENRFLKMEECEKACVRRQDDVMARSEILQTCSMDIHMLKKCASTSSLDDITLCPNVPLTSDQSKTCEEEGCCWHPTFKLCHKSTETKITGNECKILYGDNKGFVGKFTFQSPADYINGWLGYLEFSNAITGNFCILKDPWRKSKVKAVNKLLDGKMRILEGAEKMYAGQTLVVLFAATFGDFTLPAHICA